jgi:hypothetical protein
MSRKLGFFDCVRDRLFGLFFVNMLHCMQDFFTLRCGELIRLLALQDFPKFY